MSVPVIHFGEHADAAQLRPHARELLMDLLARSQNSQCLITRMVAAPHDQARVMYQNLLKYGVDSQRELYLGPGLAVIDVFEQCRKTGADERTTRAAMELKILAVGPRKVSHHCADPEKLSVIDIDPHSVDEKHPNGLDHPEWFMTACAVETRPGGRISKLLTPSSHDPAIHIEAPVTAQS